MNPHNHAVSHAGNSMSRHTVFDGIDLMFLDVKQEKEEVKVATMVFSQDDDRDKMANKTKIAPKEVKEVVVDYAVEDFDHDLVIDFSDYGTEANATAKLSLQNLEKAPVKYFDKKAQ